ncbi:rhomboid family membrane protein [Phyllosticta citribraziliensis]|uniref:Rhomboid-type serine protease n=1 Tax=Phyllosticta citribraziliensis TaxID=989973 RepID=A0ABR1L4C4_9PEZI
MASHDYYSSSNHDRREDAPLPPLPPQSTQPICPYVDTSMTSSHSPVGATTQSPFEDHAYPANNIPHNPYGPGPGEDTAYHGSAGDYYGSQTRPTDPFTDHNAIPLHSQQPKTDSPSKYNADPEGHAPLVGDYMGQAPRSKKKKGFFKKKMSWVAYGLAVIQTAVFIGEIIHNAVLTGSPIEIKPSFNPMIGPSPYVYINMGARYIPCMRQMGGSSEVNITADVAFPCPNTTTSTSECSLSQLCGMSGIGSADSNGKLHPNQWYRFITPIFLHAGLIHIVFNMLVQVTVGRDMELLIGPIRFALVYIAAGIFGNVLGANYAPNGMASTGASGAIFGIIALTLLDLLYHWRERPKPIRELCFIALDIVIAFVLGLLPGLDNFAHIGGFIMGLGLGISILHSPGPLRERIGIDDPPYSAVPNPKDPENRAEGIKEFTRQPVAFFKDRKPLWWAWWLFRAGALVAVIVGFIVLLNNFYVYHKSCNWCKHLSCLPVKNWCDIGNIELSTTSSNSKRDLFGIMRDYEYGQMGSPAF